MAVFHVKTTGSRPSGASTADNWTDANCYNDIEDALDAVTAGGDEVICDDETFNISGPIRSNVLPDSDFALTIKSRTDYGATINGTNATGRLFNFNKSGNTHDITIQGFNLTNSVTYTDGQLGCVAWVLNDTGDVTFKDCAFEVDSNIGAADDVEGAIVRLSEGTRTVTFEDVLFSNCNIEADRTTGITSNQAGNTLILTRVSINNFNVTSNNGDNFGLFYIRDTAIVTDIDVDTVTCTGSDTHSNKGIIYHTYEHGNSLTIIRGEVQKVFVIDGDNSWGFFVGSSGECTMTGTILHDNAMLSDEHATGGAFIAQKDPIGPVNTGTMNDCVVYRNTGQYGVVFYNTQGANGIINRLTAYSNTLIGTPEPDLEPGGGPIYSGGWGDLIITSSLIFRNDCEEAGGIYCHVHSLATKNKIVTINNSTIMDNTISGNDDGRDGAGIFAQNPHATYTLTININNSIIKDNTGGTAQIRTANTGEVNVALDYSYLPDSVSEGAGSGTVTDEHSISTDPTLTSLYKPDIGSSAHAAGKFISFTATDLRGRRRKIPPAIGAYEPTGGDPANTRTFR